MKTCNCTLPYTNPRACENCPNQFSVGTNLPSSVYLPINAEDYQIDFGDDFILMRKKK